MQKNTLKKKRIAEQVKLEERCSKKNKIPKGQVFQELEGYDLPSLNTGSKASGYLADEEIEGSQTVPFRCKCYRNYIELQKLHFDKLS